MAVEVDSVIVDLEARIDNYRRNMLEAIGLQERFQANAGKLANDNGPDASGASAKRAAQEVAQTEEQTTQKVTRTRKARTDAVKKADADEVASARAAAKEKAAEAKAAAKAKADALKAEVAAAKAAQREIAAIDKARSTEQQLANQARVSEFLTPLGNKGLSGSSARSSAEVFREGFKAEAEAAREAAKAEKDLQATREVFGPKRPLQISTPATVRAAGFENGANPFQAAANASGGLSAAQSAEMRATTAALAEEEVKAAAAAEARALAEAEANDMAIAMLGLKAQIIGADKADALVIQDQLFAMRQIASYQARGLTEAEAQVKVDAELLAIQERRAALAAVPHSRQGGYGGANEFAINATGGRFGYSLGAGAVAGAAAFVGAGIAAEAIESSTKYAEAIQQVAKSAGISAEGLQVYQRAAQNVGVSQDQFNGALNTLTENLGKARTGSQEQIKLFNALGVSIKTGATAGDLLPTLIDRISSISDPAQRARVEVGLFGQVGEKLDQMLSGGNDKINELAKALQDTGQILSSSDIAKLDDVAKKVAALKAQLAVDQAEVVANNAEAIERLADSFAKLANFVGKAASAYDRFASSPIGKGLSTANTVAGELNPFASAGRAIGDAIDQYGSGAAGNAVPKDATGKPVQSGAVNQHLLNNLSTPKGPKGKSAETLANEADQRTKRFNDELARAQDARLQALAQQNADEEGRRDAERKAIDDDLAKRIADLRTQARIDTRKAPAESRLIQARLDQAIAAEQAAAAEKQNVINLKSTLSAIQRHTAAENGVLEFANQQLQDSAVLARTAADRREIELKILANQQQIAKNSADEVLKRQAEGDPSITNEQVDTAKRTLRNLPADTASKTAAINRETMGPWASYIDSLPRTANEIGESFQKAAVSGVQTLNDSLAETATRLTGLHGLAGQLLTDFIRIALQSTEAQIFGGGRSGAGGGIGGLLSSVGSILGIASGGGAAAALTSFVGSTNASLGASMGSLPGFAAGGAGIIGGNPGVDQNVLSLNGVPQAKVGKGELLSISPTGVNPNARATAPQLGATNVYQTIQYQGAVDVADKSYVQQIAALQHQATKQAIADNGRQTLAATPAVMQRQQTLGS